MLPWTLALVLVPVSALAVGPNRVEGGTAGSGTTDGGGQQGGKGSGKSGKGKKKAEPAPQPAPSWPVQTQQVWVAQPELPKALTLADLRSGGAFGLGPMVGTRTGLSMKIWPTLRHAFVLDAGGTPFVNTIALGLGYQGHAATLRSDKGVAAQFTVGVGFRTRLAFVADATQNPAVTTAVPLLGARVPLGVSVTFAGSPIELWAEAGPAVDFWQALGVDVEGAAGVRVYLEARKGS